MTMGAWSCHQMETFSALTHWGRVTHICVSNLTIIGSDNGLVPTKPQAIIWTNAGILLIGPLGRNFNEILSEILTFSFKKARLNVSSAEWGLFGLGLNVLMALCAGNSPVISEFHRQRPVTRNFGIFFDLHLNKQLSKQLRCQWFETPPRSLWRHCNEVIIYTYSVSMSVVFVNETPGTVVYWQMIYNTWVMFCHVMGIYIHYWYSGWSICNWYGL